MKDCTKQLKKCWIKKNEKNKTMEVQAKHGRNVEKEEQYKAHSGIKRKSGMKHDINDMDIF